MQFKSYNESSLKSPSDEFFNMCKSHIQTFDKIFSSNSHMEGLKEGIVSECMDEYSSCFMMVAKSYYSTAHFAESFKRLDDLRANGETCDISLLASNKSIRAHKLVLASASEYFKNAIYGLFLNDSGKDELELKEIQYEILFVLVNYIYSGQIDINSENVYTVYDAADYCLMKFLKEVCLDFMVENLDIDNCLKILVMAHNCKYEKTIIAAGIYILSNLAALSDTNEFLSLSNEELLYLFSLWPKHELSDPIIIAALKWAANKENWEETVINILKDISHKNISEDFLENFLYTNEFIQNSIGCNKWLIKIYNENSKFNKIKQEESEAKLKEKLKSETEKLKLVHAESEAKQKFSTFFFDHPIIFMTYDDNSNESTFYKYVSLDDTLNLYNKINDIKYHDCKTYRNWIYVVGEHRCDRFAFDDINQNTFETAFDHNHGLLMRTAVLNDSLYIFGGTDTKKKGSKIDLNTNQTTNFSLLYDRINAGVAVCDGAIYICGADGTKIVEHFDPRIGRTTRFESIPFQTSYNYCFAASLDKQLYCTNGKEYQMIDLRYNSMWVQIQPPDSEYKHYEGQRPKSTCLVSSYGKIYTVKPYYTHHAHEVQKHSKIQIINKFPELSAVISATSFE